MALRLERIITSFFSLLLVVSLCQVLLQGSRQVSRGQSGLLSCFNKFYQPPKMPSAFFKKISFKTRNLTSKVVPCWAGCVLSLQQFLGGEAEYKEEFPFISTRKYSSKSTYSFSLAVTKLWKRELGLFNLERSPGKPSCSLSVLKEGL